MKTLPRALIPLIIALVLGGTVGCFTMGRDFAGKDAINRIQIGKTTKLELMETFGSPYRTGVEDGDQTWTYAYWKVRIGKVYTRDLYVKFDKNDVVKSYSYNTNLPE
ncbi:MAG: outer membrane protein assembly factor BamE [Nitrospinae bacterium]|nr:outer membrane protein assembly factor BamE [Nitrospinota bacterium]